MCLYPKLIPNPKYRTSKKRGYYKPSPHDARLNYVPVACGKCYECRKKKAREWRIRLAEEIRHNKSYVSDFFFSSIIYFFSILCIVTGKQIGRAHV